MMPTPSRVPLAGSDDSASHTASVSIAHAVTKRFRLVVLNLQTLGVFRFRNLAVFLVLLLFVVSGVWVLHDDDAGAPSLEDASKNELLNNEKLIQKLQEEQLPNLALAASQRRQQREAPLEEQVAAIPDSFLYPSFPNRPEIFPSPDDAHFHGRVGVDPEGRPSWTPLKPAFRMTKEQKREAHRGYCFNTRVAASLELDRIVPDYNSQRCLNVKYEDKNLPESDVIIVFHNEDLSVLLRSIHSILNRSPPQLLRSVILVNDDSNSTTHPWLFDELPKSLEFLPKTRLIHLTRRRGLMMARMEGTKLAAAEIAVYLDSHIECTKRWLEPILWEIARDRKRIVTPLIHSIEPDTFEFEHGAVSVVGFTWTLGQTHPDRPNDGFNPVESPVMAGGLFAANREWFLELGGYDPEMKLYGGEEMEIGFKTWQCGGSIVALPCSRVGHVFRTDKFWKGQVYPVPYHEIVRNKRRTAEVWMDDYKEIAFMAMAELPANVSIGPLRDVKALRDKLHCKSFKWYLQHVFPEMHVPNLEGAIKGSLSNPASNQCLDTLQNIRSGPVGPYGCHGLHGSQAFLLDGTGLLSSAQSSFEACVEANKHGDGLLASPVCKQHWAFELVPDAPKAVPAFGEHPAAVGVMKLLDGEFEGKCLTYRRKQHGMALDACQQPLGEDDSQLWQWVR
eukprot:Gregarina_sp_Pseudo_9__3181@NODE_336_length_3123_cov_19_521401_g316_i0_p1_GENE_NODE_336_length_3123_cov_19_521401_g316_i0NODE_336_length_3123_cov_19_521401_g316_i0_p1_ORF_typecomplete_len675_score202_21Glyco_tranf_2_3/PF13641_6/1_4e16Glycos_transf_2/PF00535_26/2_4e14Glyco_transf_7C/PF02709_14/1_5e10Ricin_B_lectin/PF00652_22/5e03Ricin_B_lectin/PF00652_22/7e05Ricin_B_lectin/PF00652_22/39GlcNAc/PF11397_8/8_3e05Glyco_tranf_2_2/PF10111_9/0_00012PepSY_TM_like_2/PF16357_5/0_023_NODE_336_length_3123_cov